MAEPKKDTPPQKPKTGTLDCPKKCWIEIEIRDELNGEVGSITGTIQDKCGEKWNPPRPITLGPGKNLVEGLVCGPVILAFKREALVQTALTLPMRDFGTPSGVPEYAGKVLGHKKTKCKYKMVTYNELMDQNDPNYLPGTSPCKFITKASYVLELRALREEIIAIAGTQNKLDPGDRLMFSGQAIRFLRKTLGLAVPRENTNKLTSITRRLEGGALPPGAARISFIFFTQRYSPGEVTLTEIAIEKINNDLIKLLAKKAPKVDFIKISSFDELQKYLEDARDRYLVKQVNIYCHGEPGIIGLGYKVNDSFNIASDTLKKLPAYAFSLNAQLKSYACRTGMGIYAKTEIAPFDDDRGNSIAQELADHLQLSVFAYIRKSDYVGTWGTRQDRRDYWRSTDGANTTVAEDTKGLIYGNKQSPEWCAEYHSLHEEREENTLAHKAAFNIIGAYRDVVVSEKSFLDFSGAHEEFKPR